MPPNLNSDTRQPASNPQISSPVLEILDDLVPPDLHAAAWSRCSGKGWYFGHGSNEGDGSRFWKMDLDHDEAYNAVWEHARARCEALAGMPLRVIRQYANGHTYGLGGKPHLDDNRPDTFTLLYYPNQEWKNGWDGETVFFDEAGEISFAVKPRPNRCVFFDSRILHTGRAPSRACPELRVTVAFKLERGDGVLSAAPVKKAASKPAESPVEETANTKEIDAKEIAVNGATHVYAIRIPGQVMEQAVQEQLANLGRTVRLPGFRPGHVPDAVLNERYGAKARTDSLNRFASEAIERALSQGRVPATVEWRGGGASQDLEMKLTATHLADLPAIDFSQLALTRLTADEATLQSAGSAPDAAAAMFRAHLKAQVLDHLDSAYRFAVLPLLVEREFSMIWKAAQAQAEIPADAKQQASDEFRAIAERRLRLGWVVAELARRFQIRSEQSAALEDQVVDHLVAQARAEEHVVTEQELREMMKA